MAAHGGRSRDAAQIAALDTRPDKPEPISEADLRAAWTERAAEIGLEVSRVVNRAREVGPISASDVELAEILTEKHAAFERRRVVEAVASSSRDGLLVDEVEQRVDKYLSSSLAIALPTGRWTTPEMLRIEAEVLELAKGHLAATPAEVFVDAALSERRQRDSNERQAARELRSGEVDKALARLNRASRITTDTTMDGLRDAMVRDWHVARAPTSSCSASTGATRPTSTLGRASGSSRQASSGSPSLRWATSNCGSASAS